MPHFPSRSTRSLARRYVEINGRQINLGRDEEQAFQRYHQMMLEPHTRPLQPHRRSVSSNSSTRFSRLGKLIDRPTPIDGISTCYTHLQTLSVDDRIDDASLSRAELG